MTPKKSPSPIAESTAQTPEANLTPKEIVAELDRHIIGQSKAKRSVAVALRNRWRWRQVAEELRREITPKNILMIGPTGVGKTEIARRLSKLVRAPFVKVEATKFTEVGFVGRDVESIIRDLAENAYKLTRDQHSAKIADEVREKAENRIIDVLTTGSSESHDPDSASSVAVRKLLREGKLDDKTIEIKTAAPTNSMEIRTPPGMEELSDQLRSMFEHLNSGKVKVRHLKIKDALRKLIEEESSQLLNEDDMRFEALRSAEERGIVFIDEMDKIVRGRDEGARLGADVSREGVQRDLLPLVEGSSVKTRLGTIRTDNILFIGSGAFHISRPADMIPELQGRFPIRVELNPLTKEDFESILIEPKAPMPLQSQALLETEGVTLEFTKDAISRIATIATEVNEEMENIGARRLQTIIERVVEDISFNAEENQGATVRIDAAYVDRQLGDQFTKRDLSRYIL